MTDISLNIASGVLDSSWHLVPAGFGTIRFGPELLDWGLTRSEFVLPKDTLMQSIKGIKQKVKILNMLFICRALLLTRAPAITGLSFEQNLN
jgi:hypothetical protein